MTFTEDEKKLISQGLDDAINRIATPSWKRRGRAASERFESGNATPRELAEALAPVAPSLEIEDRSRRPENFHFNLRAMVKRLSLA